MKHKTGIFRSTILKEINIKLPEEVSQFINNWNSTSCQYVDGSKIEDTRHELLNLDAYIHITSPIRRLVDLLNLIKFHQTFNGSTPLSNSADIFYNKWLNQIDYINTTMRSIKKVQNDCSLLDLCHNNPSVLEKEYNGYLFDKIAKNNGLFQYIVFLPDLKIYSKITAREEYENYANKHFKLFVFNNEERFKRKIRLQIIESNFASLLVSK
jgi:exoribonuclease R